MTKTTKVNELKTLLDKMIDIIKSDEYLKEVKEMSDKDIAIVSAIMQLDYALKTNEGE